MTAAARKYPGKVAMRRVVENARALGVDIGAIEVSPDGSIRIVDLRAVPRQPVDEFERWEGKL